MPPTQNGEPQAIARTNSGKIIIFDPVAQKLSTRKVEVLDGRSSFGGESIVPNL